jgi:hypothetical protein
MKIAAGITFIALGGFWLIYAVRPRALSRILVPREPSSGDPYRGTIGFDLGYLLGGIGYLTSSMGLPSAVPLALMVSALAVVIVSAVMLRRDKRRRDTEGNSWWHAGSERVAGVLTADGARSPAAKATG